MPSFSLTITTQGVITVTSVDLANSSIPTYGVKRTDDDFVIIPGNTPVTINVGDTWTYESTLIDPLVDYDVAFRITFSDGAVEYVFAFIQGISSQTSLRSLRRKIAQEIGGFELVFTDSAAPDLISTVSSTLIDRGASASAYNESNVYACSGDNSGKQRKVKKDSYIGENGQLSYTSDWVSQMPAGVELEIHPKMGAITIGKMKGIRECINNALEILWTVDRIPFPSTSEEDGLSAPLNSYDWLRQKSQIIGVTDNSGYSPGVYLFNDLYRFQYDAESPVLTGPEPIDLSTHQISVYRPLNTWIKKGGVWTETSRGLVDDTDECLGDHILIEQVALYFVYKALSENPFEGQQAKDRWEMKASRQAVIAKNIKLNNLPREVQTEVYRRLPTPGLKGIMGY